MRIVKSPRCLHDIIIEIISLEVKEIMNEHNQEYKSEIKCLHRSISCL